MARAVSGRGRTARLCHRCLLPAAGSSSLLSRRRSRRTMLRKRRTADDAARRPGADSVDTAAADDVLRGDEGNDRSWPGAATIDHVESRRLHRRRLCRETTRSGGGQGAARVPTGRWQPTTLRVRDGTSAQGNRRRGGADNADVLRKKQKNSSTSSRLRVRARTDNQRRVVSRSPQPVTSPRPARSRAGRPRARGRPAVVPRQTAPRPACLRRDAAAPLDSSGSSPPRASAARPPRRASSTSTGCSCWCSRNATRGRRRRRRLAHDRLSRTSGAEACGRGGFFAQAQAGLLRLGVVATARPATRAS